MSYFFDRIKQLFDLNLGLAFLSLGICVYSSIEFVDRSNLLSFGFIHMSIGALKFRELIFGLIKSNFSRFTKLSQLKMVLIWDFCWDSTYRIPWKRILCCFGRCFLFSYPGSIRYLQSVVFIFIILYFFIKLLQKTFYSIVLHFLRCKFNFAIAAGYVFTFKILIY